MSRCGRGLIGSRRKQGAYCPRCLTSELAPTAEVRVRRMASLILPFAFWLFLGAALQLASSNMPKYGDTWMVLPNSTTPSPSRYPRKTRTHTHTHMFPVNYPECPCFLALGGDFLVPNSQRPFSHGSPLRWDHPGRTSWHTKETPDLQVIQARVRTSEASLEVDASPEVQ